MPPSPDALPPEVVEREMDNAADVFSRLNGPTSDDDIWEIANALARRAQEARHPLVKAAKDAEKLLAAYWHGPDGDATKIADAEHILKTAIRKAEEQ